MQIIVSTLTLTTHDVIRDISVVAFTANDFERVLNRFMVQSISHCKDDNNMPHHKVLIVELADTILSNSGSHFLVLERTMSSLLIPLCWGALSKSLRRHKLQFWHHYQDQKSALDTRL